jgi:hypothetical protein
MVAVLTGMGITMMMTAELEDSYLTRSSCSAISN